MQAHYEYSWHSELNGLVNVNRVQMLGSSMGKIAPTLAPSTESKATGVLGAARGADEPKARLYQGNQAGIQGEPGDTGGFPLNAP